MDRIGRFGELIKPEQEAAFLAEYWPLVQKRMRFICMITALLYILAAYGDYCDLGNSTGFTLLLGIRSVVFILGVACALVLRPTKRTIRVQCLALCGFMSAVMACECLELAIKSTLVGSMGIPATVFIVLAYYLFLPPRIFVPLVAGLGGSLAYLCTLLIMTAASPGILLNNFLYFFLANSFGIFYLINYGRSKRCEFLSMQQLKELADVDDLTGIFNRRKVLAEGQSLFRAARRFNTPIAVLMLDVDRFKEINDLHGHHVGDSVLEELASRCRALLREVDIFGRLGGEEFVVVLPHSDMPQAQTAAERIRRAVGDLPFTSRNLYLNVTLSIGIQTIRPGDEDFASLLRRADNELYRAKERGRNRISPEGPRPIPISSVSA